MDWQPAIIVTPQRARQFHPDDSPVITRHAGKLIHVRLFTGLQQLYETATGFDFGPQPARARIGDQRQGAHTFAIASQHRSAGVVVQESLGCNARIFLEIHPQDSERLFTEFIEYFPLVLCEHLVMTD